MKNISMALIPSSILARCKSARLPPNRPLSTEKSPSIVIPLIRKGLRHLSELVLGLKPSKNAIKPSDRLIKVRQSPAYQLGGGMEGQKASRRKRLRVQSRFCIDGLFCAKCLVF
jgi:hypothetical protein